MLYKIQQPFLSLCTKRRNPFRITEHTHFYAILPSYFGILRVVPECNSLKGCDDLLGLKGITKNYLAGDNEVHALKGIDIQFRQNEFVAVLGPSGCGKTTLLNIIGGLDRYTEGDLTIADKSTKEYRDRDWDHYRNHTIGFIYIL